MLYYSSTLRIDTRLRAYYTNSGQLWATVTGVHPTATQVIDGDCDVKIDIYCQYQISARELRFSFYGVEIGWTALLNRLRTCSEICAGKYEVDRDDNQLTVTFADGIMATLKIVENMHALFITVPYETISSDLNLINEDKLCTGEIRGLNCDNDNKIFTYYDYDPETGMYVNCSERPNPISFESEDDDLNIATLAAEVFAGCDAPCLILSLVKSCEYDVCAAPMMVNAWNAANEEVASEEAQTITDEYCV